MTKDKPQIIKIHMKTMYKLIFFINHSEQKLPNLRGSKLENTKANIVLAKKLLNMEPVKTTDYQALMVKINKLITEEETFQSYVRR